MNRTTKISPAASRRNLVSRGLMRIRDRAAYTIRIALHGDDGFDARYRAINLG